MSHYLKDPIYGPQGLELHWVNSIVHSHGLFCGCDNTFEHLQSILQRKGHKQLCLTTFKDTEDAASQTGDDDIGISPGDLEKLFATDTEDDSG